MRLLIKRSVHLVIGPPMFVTNFISDMGDQVPGEDFPLLCETCLGTNPMVRMTKLPYGHKLCKISELPYQGFRWKAGPNGRFKETVISYVVAVEKNICQCCLMDLRYGLPVGVRDAMIKKASSTSDPQSVIGRQTYYSQKQIELQQAGGLLTDGNNMATEFANLVPSRQLDHFAASLHSVQKSAVAFRNLPKLCSFWLNGKCTRVARKTCPFRPCCGTFVFPEIASNREICSQLIERLNTEGPDAVQRSLDAETQQVIREALKGNRDASIRNRVAGNDDLTKKYLNKLHSSSSILSPPEESSIKTLWLGGVDDAVSEADLRSALYPYGPLVSVHISRPSKCAFVEYPDRHTAEYAASMLYNSFQLQGRAIAVNWAKPRGAAAATPEVICTETGDELMPAPPGMERCKVEEYALPNLPLPVVSRTVAPSAEPSAAPPSSTTSVQSSRGKRKAELLAELAELDNEDDGPWSAGPPQQQKPRRGPMPYPAMDPLRLGAKC